METQVPIQGFSCVEMKREGAERVYQAIKDLSPEEQDAYWQDRYKSMISSTAQQTRRAS